MKNLRFDIDLSPNGAALKNRSAVIQGEDRARAWSIGVRDNRYFLNRKGGGDVLRFAYESPHSGWKRWLPGAVLVIRDLTGQANEVARLEWKFEEAGIVTFAGDQTFALVRNRPEPAVSGKCLRLSIIDLRSRLIVPKEFAAHAETLMIVAYEILKTEMAN